MGERHEPLLGRVGFTVISGVITSVILLLVTGYMAAPKEQSDSAHLIAQRAADSAARNSGELADIRREVAELRAAVSSYSESTDRRLEAAAKSRFTAEDQEEVERRLGERQRFNELQHDETRDEIARVEKRVDAVIDWLSKATGS